MKMELSDGFVHDVKELLCICKDNKTDKISIKMDTDDYKIIMDIQFGIEETQQ